MLASTCRTRRRWRSIAAGSTCLRPTWTATRRCWNTGLRRVRSFLAELGIEPGEGLHLTPVAGGTLLHLAIEYDDIDVARWLIERGADVNAKAAIDADGFGGHTPLFHTVVTLAAPDDSKARLLLETRRRPQRPGNDPEATPRYGRS